MAIVIDTNVLWHPEVLDLLEDEDVVVPSLVVLERCRQLRARGRDPVELLRNLDRLGWRVEPHDAEHALRSALLAPLDDKAWLKLARDAIIAGHVGPADVLWTFNAKDFRALGMAKERVVDLGA
jgi:predicted nucleic acid-binding protein